MDAEYTPFFPMPCPIAADIPLEDLHCIQWARTMPRSQVEVIAYLRAHGFTVGAMRITENQYWIVDMAFNHFHRTAPRVNGTFPLSAFLVPVDAGGFWIDAPGRQMRANPTEKLVSALSDAGWIYEPKPENTYFQILKRDNGRRFLVAKYQQIIGSRVVCELETE